MAGSKVATADIYPSRFVKLASSDGKVTQAGAGEKVFAVSGPGTNSFPFQGLDTGLHASAGQNCRTYEMGEKCLLELGGTVTAGDYLKADADGKGVTASSDQDDVGAIAQWGGTSGKLIEVKVHIAERSTA